MHVPLKLKHHVYSWADAHPLPPIHVDCTTAVMLKGTSNNCLRPLAFSLGGNQGATLKACWLPGEKLQRRVPFSLKAP